MVISSREETDFLIKEKKEIKTIIHQICNIGKYDLILIEGAKDKFISKIRLGDIKQRENTILTYSGNFKELIELIKKEILRSENMENISIKVNGKQIPLTNFPTEIIKNTICGMLKSLKGVDEIEDVEIKIQL